MKLIYVAARNCISCVYNCEDLLYTYEFNIVKTPKKTE